MAKISQVKAYEILASGGYPTLEVEVILDSGHIGKASVPYGASAGSHEASVLNDGDVSRYEGKGVLKAISNVLDKIAPMIIGMDAGEQREIDNKMIALDGTENKANLGGNSILAVSLAVARAAAASEGKELYRYIIDKFNTQVKLERLPSPMIVMIEGGKHADETTDLQEFCVSAVGDQGVSEKVRMVMEIYHKLRGVLKSNDLSVNVGNEGAFAPNGIPDNEAPFKYIVEAIEKAGYDAPRDVAISIDAAASEFYVDGKYHLKVENRTLSADELIAYYETWLEKYPIVTFEDMLHEDDWENWVKLTPIVKNHKVENIGDDLTVTNLKRLQKAIDLGAITAILIKLNQAGSLTETLDCCMLANKYGLMTTTSHRGGGETNDTAMVDLAVAVGSRFIKVGPTRGERVSKYNRLMEIEREVIGN